MADKAGTDGPAGIRHALAEYVRALHEAYVAALRDHGVDARSLPLGRSPFTVAVVAANELHLVATRDRLPPEAPHEEPVFETLHPLAWTVRFLDVTVVSDLADLPDDDPDGNAVLDAIGVKTPLYHLAVRLDGSLTPHQAFHAGTGLANAHLGHGS